MKIPELLAPAGNFDKMETAFHFGADAVYLGLKQFSLRNFAENFTVEEFEEAVRYAHALSKKVYLTLNMFPLSSDIKEIKTIIPLVRKIGPDGIIIADPGMVALLKREAPELKLHLSTQANTMNSDSVRFWADAGISRIVLARELSLDEISELVQNSNIELEVFIHGALCISYSGRCFLSLYMSGRDANRGECAQSCRWKYRVLEEAERKGEFFPIEEGSSGTYIFNSKDLCALPLLPELVSSGVDSLKIEGRMKSAHYVAISVDVYRKGLDILKEKGTAAFRKIAPELVTELARVSNRGFTTNFFKGKPGSDDYNVAECRILNPYAFIGEIVGEYDGGLLLKLKNPVYPGDKIELCDSPYTRETVTVENIVDFGGDSLDFGRSGTVIRLKGRFRSGVGALARNG
ncbi:MAG: U32 family peptidase [Acidobacteria bacterium]|nr:U32 family peptidase [Acidobacteriota bacterium]